MDSRPMLSMGTAELIRLQLDHSEMRENLKQLKSVLNGGAPYQPEDRVRIQQEARRLCASLAGKLNEHVQKEDRLAAYCSQADANLGLGELGWQTALEHHVDQENLRSINQLLAHEGNGWLTDVGPMLIALIASLKRQMDAQEAELFPLMDRLSSADGSGNGAIPR